MNFLESFKTLPLLAPADGGDVSTGSGYVDLDLAEGQVEIGLQFGEISSSDSTGGLTVTVEASTEASSNSGDAAVPFRYQLSSAVETDSWGPVSEAAASGVEIVSTDYANCMMLIYVDPAAVAALGADYRYVRAFLTANTVTAFFRSAYAKFAPRYAGANMESST